MIGILKLGPIMALSVSDRYQQIFYYYRFPVPISVMLACVTEISQNCLKNVGKTLKLNPKCDYQLIILCLSMCKCCSLLTILMC